MVSGMGHNTFKALSKALVFRISLLDENVLSFSRLKDKGGREMMS